MVCSRGQVKVCCKYILLTCPLKRKSRRKAEKIDGAEHLCVVYTSIYAYYTIMYKHTYTTQWHTFMDWLYYYCLPIYLHIWHICLGICQIYKTHFEKIRANDTQILSKHTLCCYIRYLWAKMHIHWIHVTWEYINITIIIVAFIVRHEFLFVFKAETGGRLLENSGQNNGLGSKAK